MNNKIIIYNDSNCRNNYYPIITDILINYYSLFLLCIFSMVRFSDWLLLPKACCRTFVCLVSISGWPSSPSIKRTQNLETMWWCDIGCEIVSLSSFWCATVPHEANPMWNPIPAGLMADVWIEGKKWKIKLLLAILWILLSKIKSLYFYMYFIYHMCQRDDLENWTWFQICMPEAVCRFFPNIRVWILCVFVCVLKYSNNSCLESRLQVLHVYIIYISIGS